VLKITWLLGVIFGGIFFFAGERIGILVYRDNDSGFLIKILAPLVPLMYLDSISDGILKGLDQQIFTFRNAVLDSSLRIILILFIVPKSGIDGFLVIMFFSNLLTCFLNVARLLKVSGVKPKLINDILLPTLSGVGICMCFSSFLKGIQNNIIYTLSFGSLSLCFYIIFLFAFKIVDIHDYI
jgi:stage V sporulation protein B